MDIPPLPSVRGFTTTCHFAATSSQSRASAVMGLCEVKHDTCVSFYFLVLVIEAFCNWYCISHLYVLLSFKSLLSNSALSLLVIFSERGDVWFFFPSISLSLLRALRVCFISRQEKFRFLTCCISEHVNTVSQSALSPSSIWVFGGCQAMHSVSFHLAFIGRMNALRQTSASPNNASVRAWLLSSSCAQTQIHKYIMSLR